MHQMLSVVYPCDWSQFDVFFQHSKTLSSLCNGDFHVSVSDVCILIDGIGWIQICPLASIGSIVEKVFQQRGIDIRPFQLCIDDCQADFDVLVAAFLPRNRFYLCDSMHQRFDNFLTPSVKRRRLAAGTFAAQPVLVSVDNTVYDSICIDFQHSTANEKCCVRLERGCKYTYSQIVKLALHDFVRPLVCELLQPNGNIEDVFRSRKNGMNPSLRKDELFESGEKEVVFFDTSLQFVLQGGKQSGSSPFSFCCNKILSDLRTSDEDYLANVFHDEICFRRKMSGFHGTSLRRILFKQWKSFADDRKLMRLRSDEALMSFFDFLHRLTPGEREVVLPLLVQARKKIEDIRIRKEEIRNEKIFTLRSQLLAESSAWKKRKILDDWLGFKGFEGTHSDVEVGNGLFLRGNVRIEDNTIWTFLQKKIQELAKRVGVWRHAWGKKCLWTRCGENNVDYYGLESLGDLWNQVVTDTSVSEEGHCGFFVPSDNVARSV